MMRKRKGILLDDVRIWNERNAFFYMENNAGEQYQISRKLYYQLIYLEQTNCIPSDENFPSKFLQKKGFISTSRLIKQSMFVRRWIVAYIGERGRSLYPICHVINKILPFLALALLVLGIVANAIKRTPFIWYNAILIHIIGIVITVIVHELGHLIAYMDYNRENEIKITDVGILLFLFFPIGGYIGVKYSDLLRKRDQIQGLAAGFEMNIAVVGLILLGRIVNPYFDIFSPVILYSVTAIIFNSLPINGTDGCQILSVLLGVNNIWTTAKATFSDKRRVEKLVHGGKAGWFCLMLFYFQHLIKIIVVLLEAGSAFFLLILGYYYFSPFN